MTTYTAQSRRPAPDARWRHIASGFPTAMAVSRAQSLGDAMIKVGFRYSELDAHRYDLVTGLVLTAEDGTQFRIVAEPMMTLSEASAPEPTVTFTRAELLDLLTAAACIGRETVTFVVGGTRGDITDYLLTYRDMRDALPKEV